MQTLVMFPLVFASLIRARPKWMRVGQSSSAIVILVVAELKRRSKALISQLTKRLATFLRLDTADTLRLLATTASHFIFFFHFPFSPLLQYTTNFSVSSLVV